MRSLDDSNKSFFQFKNPSLVSLSFSINEDFDDENKEQIDIPMQLTVTVKNTESAPEAIVILDVRVGKEGLDCPYYITAVEQSNFRWGEELDSEAVKELLNQNAPALLLSYVRPIISQITSVSKYGSYNIPFVNFIGR